MTPSQPLAGALARALSMASKRFFKQRHSAVSRQSQRRPIIRDREGSQGRESPGSNIANGPREEALLARLEDLAQKTQVLANWADEMYDYVRDTSQSKNSSI